MDTDKSYHHVAPIELTTAELKMILRLRQLKDTMSVMQVIVNDGQPVVIMHVGKAEGLMSKL